MHIKILDYQGGIHKIQLIINKELHIIIIYVIFLCL